MGLRINSSITSLQANNALQRTQKAIARSLERLASGKRVNSFRDDAAAYVQGVTLTSQIRGITQGIQNINQGLGMIETADSAISSQMDLVARMRELALMAANGSLTDQDRSNLNLELQELVSEYDRITSNTEFNGAKLLDGSFGTRGIQVGTTKQDSIDLGISSTVSSGIFIQRTTINSGTFQTGTTQATETVPFGIATGDIDEDGDLDIIVGQNSGLSLFSVYLGNGDGTLTTRSTLTSSTNPMDPTLVDLNADSHLDLVIVNQGANNLSVYLGNGNGTFQTRVTYLTGTDPARIEHADLNSDGFQDIVVTNYTPGSIGILFGNGNGTLQTVQTIATGPNPLAPLLTDINKDGKIDILTPDNSSSTISIHLGNGNGTFATRTTLAAGAGPYFIAAGDINGDSNIDLINAEASASTVGVYLGNGNGTFSGRTPVTTAAGPLVVHLVDMNRDGKLDLVSGNFTAGSISLSLGNGNGTFQTATTVAGATRDLLVADFNNDGVYDYALDTTTATVGILLGNSAQKLSSASPSITTQESALIMLDVFDSAMESLGTARAKLAALHSRLDSAASSNLLLYENLEEARSSRIDTDYALEISDLVRNQILAEAQVAVLAQANIQTSLALKLIENIE